jgi:hypothetical protein
VNRTPRRKNRLLLIAGRVQGVPQISFDVEPVGTVTANMSRADVGCPVQPNALKRMMRPQLITQATVKAVGFTDVQCTEVPVIEALAEDVDASDGSIDRTNRI